MKIDKMLPRISGCIFDENELLESLKSSNLKGFDKNGSRTRRNILQSIYPFYFGDSILAPEAQHLKKPLVPYSSLSKMIEKSTIRDILNSRQIPNGIVSICGSLVDEKHQRFCIVYEDPDIIADWMWIMLESLTFKIESLL
jgi:hypothetical protein